MWVIIATIWMTSLMFQNVSAEIDTEKHQHQYRSTRFSVGFHVFLPVAGLILLVLGRKHIFENILLQLDKRYLRVICPRFIKKEAFLKWASGRLPPTWSSYSTKTLSGGIRDLWIDGSLLCTLINTGVPGACPNPHRHWKQPPVHAQALAYKYFGVAPIFTNEELNKKLSSTLERRFLMYLSDIQQSINRTSDYDRYTKISDRYIVRGMGLFSGEQFKTAIFYIYLDENVNDDNESNIIIQIKGPFGSFGEAVAPKLINKKRKRRPIKTDRRQSLKLIENLQSLQSNIINFTRSTKKFTGEEIDVEAILENDRIKVTYYPKHYGMYEINMVGGGEVLKCCPFNVHVFANENSVDESTLKKKHLKTVRKIKGTLQNEVIYEEKTILTKNVNKNEITEKEHEEENTVDDNSESNANSNLKYECNQNQQEIPVNKVESSNEINKHITSNDKSECDEIPQEIHKNKVEPNKEVDKNITSNDKLVTRAIITEEKDEPDTKITTEHILNENADITVKSDKENEIVDATIEPTLVIEKINFFDKNINKIGNAPQKNLSVSNDTINANNSILNKRISNGGNNLKSNNVIIEQTNDGKQAINEVKQVDHKSMSYIVEPKYLKNININKIKIPERFVDVPIKLYANNLDDKYIKNIVNESNKNVKDSKLQKKSTSEPTSKVLKTETFEHLNIDTNEINNNNNNNTIKHRVQMYLEKLETNSKRDTSPICFDHIVPEVDSTKKKKKSVAEKRKIFALSSLGSEPNSINSSFSENESSLGSIAKNCHPRFTVFNNVKEPSNSAINGWSLCSTISLPNLSLESEWSSVGSVKDKKFFWENISSRSSSSVSTKSLSPKKINNTLSELERSKLIWKKPDECIKNEVTIRENKENIFKSADDILSLSKGVIHSNTKKYQSVDESLDKCTVLSIEERKKLLLRQAYDIEKTTVKSKIVYKTKDVKNATETKKEGMGTHFSPISNKIKRYNSALHLSTEKTTTEKPNVVRKVKSFHNSPNSSRGEVESSNYSVHHQFNMAIKYFKNLEAQSQNINIESKKSNSVIHQTPAARYRTGSLNIPNVSQKYSINNLYDDIFGNKNSFKGTPNRSAVVQALATFPRTSNSLNNNNNNEEYIKYDIFKHAKKRKRKSLNCVFDVFY